MENPYKRGDRIVVVASAYNNTKPGHTGTVCHVFSPGVCNYCVWAELDHLDGQDWPFLLTEIAPLAAKYPAGGSV